MNLGPGSEQVFLTTEKSLRKKERKKDDWQMQFEEGRVYLGWSLGVEGRTTRAGKRWWQLVTLHLKSGDREECCYSEGSLFFIKLRVLRLVVPPQFTYTLEACLQGDSRSCQMDHRKGSSERLQDALQVELTQGEQAFSPCGQSVPRRLGYPPGFPHLTFPGLESVC